MKTQIQQPYAIIEKDGNITRYDGILYKFASLKWLQDFYRQQTAAIIFLTPFRTIRERGFESHGEEPILAIQVQDITSLTREQVQTTISDKEILFEEPIAPTQSDEDFAKKVWEIQTTEIAGWNICQMILSQPYVWKIANFSEQDVESAFQNALEQKWQYMTVLFSDGEGQYFVSLTPEQHLGISENTITMNPIAGTLRKWDRETFRERLGGFITNPKEINELFHVLDEELKMMEVICDEWGKIEWPFLRQNWAVVHTEYKLIGKRNHDIEPLDALRETLHAPTLVGGPIESAARLIEKYEPTSRGYYGGEIGILTPDGTLDSAIMIRFAHFQKDGTVTIQAWAGITKWSIPLEEAAEVRAKTWGIQAALTGNTTASFDVQSILDKPEIQKELKKRNTHLSKFHLIDQSGQEVCEELKWKTATVIDNEDNFSKILARMMRKMGMKVIIVKTTDFNPATDSSDIVVLWPGPGDINDMSDTKMHTLARYTEELIKEKRNLLGICLGHQSIAKEMWHPVQRMIEPQQWQSWFVQINFTSERVGFYNSFVPIFLKNSGYMDGGSGYCSLEVIQKGNISWFQFHPESVMSENGYEILKNELIRIFSCK